MARKIYPKTCKNAECKKKFKPRYPNEIVCSGTCKIAYSIQQGRKNLEKQKAERKKEERRKKLEFKKSDPKYVKPKLQAAINKLARTIDSGLPCLATGTKGQMHGGHVFSRGAHPQMKYNLHNIHRQSAYSNNKQSHDGLMQEKLAEEYGEEYLQYLKDLRGSEQIKLTTEELYEKYLLARKLQKEIEESLEEVFLPMSRYWRIKLRSYVNEKLEIYPSELNFQPNQ